MSSQSKKGKKPAHQNEFAFKHNKHSKLTAKILAAPNLGLCHRCTDIVEWRKRYRKYKPLSQPKKCTSCSQKTVTLAYHVICDKCAIAKGVCAKCLESKEIVNEVYAKEQQEKEMKELEEGMKKLTERERRTLLRRLARGDDPEEISQVTNTKAQERAERKKLGFDDFDDFGDEDDDEDDDGGKSKSKSKQAGKPTSGLPAKNSQKDGPKKSGGVPTKPTGSAAPSKASEKVLTKDKITGKAAEASKSKSQGSDGQEEEWEEEELEEEDFEDDLE
eukprot:TRINITY_DN8419_c0_g2_i1.p1 TRINITY_DN8419_c0_g2~~TRINITY_DN8419_c0_g2_i1.p1  ORF type:complete len:275 (-),score=86.99 TRINITY_DN8419_c0_g2_i1:57-881(-)